MKYTIFIDESGDFTSQRGEWVVAGLLFPDSLENAERRLNKAFDGLAGRFGIEDERQFHATELRRHKDFYELRSDVLARPFLVDAGCRLLAVINVSKKKLSTSEATYRLMLQDLVALADSALSTEITGLDLHIATRTIDGHRLTTEDDIKVDVLSTLPQAMESGLAARGLITLSDNGRISVYPGNAKNAWGLRVADFLANLVFHRKEEVAATLLDGLRAERRLLTFNSLGGYEQRRANIAERDGDHVMAIQRWLLINPTSEESARERDEAVHRLTVALVSAPGTTAARNSIEVLIERIQRGTSRSSLLTTRFRATETLERSIDECIHGSEHTRSVLLFRVRNYLLLTANHLGDAVSGRRIVRLQENALTSQAKNPEEFFKVIQFLLYRSDVANNEMDFQASANMAQEYLRIVGDFQELLGLLPLNSAPGQNERSDAWIKAKTNLLRCQILATPIFDTADLMSLVEQLHRLSETVRAPSDKCRLVGYSVWALLKAGHNNDALMAVAELIQQKIFGYDLLWAARAASDWVIMHPGQNHSGAERVLHLLREQNLEYKADADLRSPLLREQAILEGFFAHDRRRAKRLMDVCLKSTASIPIRSAFSLWSLQILRYQKDVLDNRECAFSDYFRKETIEDGLETYRKTCEDMAVVTQNGLCTGRPLYAARRATPI